MIPFDKKCILTKFHVLLTSFPEIIIGTIENDGIFENNKRPSIFDHLFDDFIVLIDIEIHFLTIFQYV